MTELSSVRRLGGPLRERPIAGIPLAEQHRAKLRVVGGERQFGYLERGTGKWMGAAAESAAAGGGLSRFLSRHRGALLAGGLVLGIGAVAGWLRLRDSGGGSGASGKTDSVTGSSSVESLAPRMNGGGGDAPMLWTREMQERQDRGWSYGIDPDTGDVVRESNGFRPAVWTPEMQERQDRGWSYGVDPDTGNITQQPNVRLL